MPQSVESSGKTIEQALQKALRELAAQPEEVDIEILEGANKGFLGGLFGSKAVSIRVTLREAKRTVPPPAAASGSGAPLLRAQQAPVQKRRRPVPGALAPARAHDLRAPAADR